MLLRRLQEHLEAIYDTQCGESVADYVVDEGAAKRLGATGRSEEELLVCEEEAELQLGLYLSPALLDRAEQAASGQAEDLDAFLRVAEGVSHFLYVVHTASAGRRVSLLELEAQAEVDKFALCVMRTWPGMPSRAEALLGQLFDQVRYHAHLSAAERWRYEEANRLSRNYCRRLLPHIAQRRLDRLLTSLRYSYRLGAEAKLRHLGQPS